MRSESIRLTSAIIDTRLYWCLDQATLIHEAIYQSLIELTVGLACVK